MLERDYEGKTYTILFKFYFFKKLGGILNQSLSHFLKIVIQQFVVLTTAKYDLTVRNDCSWHDMRVNGSQLGLDFFSFFSQKEEKEI
jgi:hypothetical protein